MTSDRPYRAALPADARAPSCSATRQPGLPRRSTPCCRLDGRPSAPARCRPRARPHRPARSELRALIAVAGAVAAAHRLEDVLEVVAEETRRVVGALVGLDQPLEREHDACGRSSTSGSWARRAALPDRRTYELADYPLAARLLRDGESYVVSRGDEGLGPADRQLLDSLNKGSYIGVPVIFDGRTWASSRRSPTSARVPFTRRHVPFLEAIAGQVGAAIGRAELFSRVNALAYADPLTGLGNRRALDERLEAAVDRGGRARDRASATSTASSRSTTARPRRGRRAIRRAATRSPAPRTGGPAPRSTASAATSSASCSRTATRGGAAALAGRERRARRRRGSALALLRRGRAAPRRASGRPLPRGRRRPVRRQGQRPRPVVVAAPAPARRRRWSAARIATGPPRDAGARRAPAGRARRRAGRRARRAPGARARPRCPTRRARRATLPRWTYKPCARSSPCSNAPHTSTPAPTARCRRAAIAAAREPRRRRSATAASPPTSSRDRAAGPAARPTRRSSTPTRTRSR